MTAPQLHPTASRHLPSSALRTVPFFWFAEHWLTHRKEVPLRSLLARLAYVMAVVGFGLGFSVFASDSEITDEVNNYCSAMHTQEQCDGWPLLSHAQCDAALSCVTNGTASGSQSPKAALLGAVVGDGDGESGLCAGSFQPNFNCSWEPVSSLNAWTRLIAPRAYVQGASCVRIACPLSEYARGVALEFAVLFLTLCYVTTFALHDMRRLLDRPPPDERRTANRALASADEAGGEAGGGGGGGGAEYAAPNHVPTTASSRG